MDMRRSGSDWMYNKYRIAHPANAPFVVAPKPRGGPQNGASQLVV